MVTVAVDMEQRGGGRRLAVYGGVAAEVYFDKPGCIEERVLRSEVDEAGVGAKPAACFLHRVLA